MSESTKSETTKTEVSSTNPSCNESKEGKTFDRLRFEAEYYKMLAEEDQPSEESGDFDDDGLPLGAIHGGTIFHAKDLHSPAKNEPN